MPYFQLEKIEYGYKELITTYSRQYLDEVEGLYLDEQAVPLPDIAEIHKGMIPQQTVMVVIAEFPAVTVEAVNVDLMGGAASSTGAQTLMLITVYTIHGDDPEIANSYAQRVGAAIAGLISERKPMGVGIKNVGPVTLATSETMLAADDDLAPYLKLARIQCVLEVGAIL